MEIKFKHVENLNSTKPYNQQEFINLSVTIKFFDMDDDDYISKNDYLLLSTKDIDNNINYNLTQMQFGLILIEEHSEIGIINLNKNTIPEGHEHGQETIG